MTRRRLIAAPVLALGLALALAGCAEDDDAAEPPLASPGDASPTMPAESPAESPMESPAESPAESPDASPAESPGGSPAGSPAGETVEIVGVDYAYQNVPTVTEPGTTFTFTNEGSEVHEMLVLRRNDDVTESWQDLIALPQQELVSLVTVTGNALAEPGQDAQTPVNLAQPGSYVMICFVPTGTTEIPDDPTATLPPGPPHFTQGMLAEFRVEE